MTTTPRRSNRGVAVKSVREPAARTDGERILVDRLWPRGVSKERAHLDAWEKGLAPSTELRQWFGHDPSRWTQFRQRYWSELKESGATATLRDINNRAQQHKVTLVFGASDTEHNNAVALAGFAHRM